MPALFAAYKKQNWAFSAMIGIVGSGGFVKYDEGIPMFEVPIRALLAQAGMMPDKYNYSSNMKGKQYTTTTSLLPLASGPTTTMVTIADS